MVTSAGNKKREFMSVKEVAHELGVGPWIIWKWIRQNKAACFPMKRIGQRIFISRTQFEKWCETFDNR
jgi:predicted DNA-binding transcriptional regulator AlpA